MTIIIFSCYYFIIDNILYTPESHLAVPATRGLSAMISLDYWFPRSGVVSQHVAKSQPPLPPTVVAVFFIHKKGWHRVSCTPTILGNQTQVTSPMDSTVPTKYRRIVQRVKKVLRVGCHCITLVAQRKVNTSNFDGANSSMDPTGATCIVFVHCGTVVVHHLSIPTRWR